MSNFYQKLGVDRNASTASIRKAFAQKARKLHPEFNQKPEANAEFKSLIKAYTVLREPSRRKQYNRLLDMGKINPESKLKWQTEMEANALNFSKMSFKEFRKKKIFLHLFSQNLIVERILAIALMAATISLSFFVISGRAQFNIDPYGSKAEMDPLAPYIAAFLIDIICWVLLISFLRIEFSNLRIKQSERKSTLIR